MRSQNTHNRNTHNRKRLVRARALPLLALSTACGLLASPARAQVDLFVTGNRTIAGGNPVNGDYGKIVLGLDSLNNPFPDVVADITGGSSTDFINATNRSLLTISGGTFGRAPDNQFLYTGLNVVQGSTVNMTGGTIRGFVNVGSDSLTVSTFNLSGGSILGVFNNGGGVVNMTGGSVGGAGGGFVGNYGTGTLNISGGTMNSVANVGYEPDAVTNFGGSAVTNYLTAYNGTLNMTGGSATSLTVGGSYYQAFANISGGAIGSGGFTVGTNGQAIFVGSGLSVIQTGTSNFFDPNYYQNFTQSTYTVAGTLNDGLAFSTSLTGGADYTNTGSLATFGGSAIAPDLYVPTDQVVNGFYNNVNVGYDEDFNTYSPTATIADGNDTVFLSTGGGSSTTIDGGIIRGDLYAGDQSTVDIRGGQIDGGIYASGDSAVTMRGGLYNGYGVYLNGNGSFTVQGTNVTATGTVGQLWDPNAGVNYVSAGNFQVSATFADGNTFDQSIVAGGASGDSTRQTLIAPVAASDLFIEQNRTVDTIQNGVYIGQAGGSPAVGFQDGANTGSVFLYNRSTLDIEGGIVNGTIYSGRDVNLNIRGGTVDRVFQSYTGGVPSDGVITVSGGTTNYIAPSNRMVVTGGQLGTLDTYAGARVQITGGDIGRILAFGSQSLRGDIAIFGGSVNTIIGYGGAVNIVGGNIGAGNLYNLGGSPFTLFGANFTITNAMLGTYQGRNGVWWDVAGLLQGGQSLSTRYFEANGNLNGPMNLMAGAAAPEPSALLLLVPGVAVGLLARRRRRS